MLDNNATNEIIGDVLTALSFIGFGGLILLAKSVMGKDLYSDNDLEKDMARNASKSGRNFAKKEAHFAKAKWARYKYPTTNIYISILSKKERWRWTEWKSTALSLVAIK